MSGVGGPEVLTAVERACPQPADNEVLIRVAAAGVNHVDLRQRKGLNPVDPRHQSVPGLEVAGRIVAVGKDVRRWRNGDRVCALLPGGGYASYACADASLCLPIPGCLDAVAAAALPEALFTVWSALVDMGKLATRRNRAGAWRRERHRHRGHSDRLPARRARTDDRGLA